MNKRLAEIMDGSYKLYGLNSAFMTFFHQAQQNKSTNSSYDSKYSTEQFGNIITILHLFLDVIIEDMFFATPPQPELS